MSYVKNLASTKLKVFISAILIVLLTLSGCAVTKKTDGSAQMLQNGTGYTNVLGITKTPAMIWRQILPPPFLYNGNSMDPTTIVNGRIYLSTTAGYRAIELDNGKTLWENTNINAGLSVNSLQYFRGNLYTVSYFSKKYSNKTYIHLICLDSKNGNMIWQSPILGTMPKDVSNNMVFLKDKVYICGYIGETPGIYCFNASNGDTVYKLTIKDLEVYFSSLITNGKYIYGFMSKYDDNTVSEIDVFCLDPVSKNIIWKFSVGDKDMYNFRWMRLGLTSSTLIVQYLAVPVNNITPNEITVIKTFDLKTHKELWEKRTCCIDKNDKSAFRLKNNPSYRFQYFQIPDFSTNGKIVFTTLGDGKLIAVDIKTGKILWLYDEKDGLPDDKDKTIHWFGVIRTHCVKNVLYASINLPNRDKDRFIAYIYAFDVNTGKILWNKPLEDTNLADVRITPIDKGIVIRYGNTGLPEQNEKLELWK